MKARITVAMTAECASIETTKEDIPRLGSGCTVNRVIVREDLIRRMAPLLVGCLLLFYLRSGFSNGLDVAGPDTPK